MTEDKKQDQQTPESDHAEITPQQPAAGEAPTIPNVGRSIEMEVEEDDVNSTDVSDESNDVVDEDPRNSHPRPTYGVNEHINISRPVLSSRDTIRKHRFRDFERLPVLGLSAEEANLLTVANDPVLKRLADGLKNSRDLNTERYMETLMGADSTRYDGGTFDSSLTREDSKWDNTVVSGATKLSIVRPKFEAPNENDRLVGQAAVERMRAHLSLGSVLRVPLWHSGLWVTLKAPNEVALLELQRRIAADKITIGRNTSGLVFSNASVYVKSYLLDFILLHVVEATYRYTDVDELKALIREPDYLALVHGLLCTIYPDGYPYSQPCFINPDRCMHVIQETISLPRIAFTDTFRLTEKQRAHMVRKNAKFTELELEAYQAEFGYRKTRVVELNESTRMELRLPDLESSISLGTGWIDQIVSRAERALGPSVAQGLRDQFMIDQARVSSMCQYVHFVERIILNEEDDRQTIVEDPATISEMLAVSTANEEFYQNFYNGIQNFIEDATITVFGVPKVPCPSCSKDDVERAKQEDPEGRYSYLLPLDIQQIFFILLSLRLTRIYQQDV